MPVGRSLGTRLVARDYKARPEEVGHGDVGRVVRLRNHKLEYARFSNNNATLLTFMGDLRARLQNYPDFQAIAERKDLFLSQVSRVHYYTLGLVELYLPLDMKSIFPLWPFGPNWPYDLGEKKPSQ